MIQVFCDFDGTITTRDVGDAMFEKFGGRCCTDIRNEYREGKISAVECFRRECEACGEVEVDDLDRFLSSQEIDKSFQEFAAFCREQGFALTVLSDGMEYYMKKIFERHQIDLPFFANVLELIPSTGPSKIKFFPSFPFTDEVCSRCACCKRNQMLTQSADDDIIVYIGEGYSDRCPVRYADVIFAKDELLTYCQQEHLPCYHYTTFRDVVEQMKKFLLKPNSRHRFRKRRQAELARREVFIIE